jgi:hypothetical protein
MIAVISFPRRHRRLGAQFFPDAFGNFVVGDRIYRFCHVAGIGVHETQAFRDPLDGELLIDVRYFTTESAARAWVSDRMSSEVH